MRDPAPGGDSAGCAVWGHTRAANETTSANKEARHVTECVIVKTGPSGWGARARATQNKSGERVLVEERGQEHWAPCSKDGQASQAHPWHLSRHHGKPRVERWRVKSGGSALIWPRSLHSKTGGCCTVHGQRCKTDLHKHVEPAAGQNSTASGQAQGPNTESVSARGPLSNWRPAPGARPCG